MIGQTDDTISARGNFMGLPDRKGLHVLALRSFLALRQPANLYVGTRLMPNATELIAQYIKLRDYVAKRSAEHAAELKPYQDAMATIEAAGSAILIETSGGDEGKANIVTPAGTMYRKRWTSIKMASRPDFMAFVASDWTARQSFLTSAVTKSEVEDFIEREKAVPPGLDIARGYQTLFNKPKG